MGKLFKTRTLFTISFLISTFALLAAYALENFKGVQPCPLCMIQRFLIGGIILASLMAFLHNPRSLLGIRIYSVFLLIFSALGMGVAYRHASLYSLPPESLPSCGGTLSYLIKILPWKEALSAIWKGSDSCVKDTFQIFSLHIPEWAFLAFAAVFILGIFSFSVLDCHAPQKTRSSQ